MVVGGRDSTEEIVPFIIQAIARLMIERYFGVCERTSDFLYTPHKAKWPAVKNGHEWSPFQRFIPSLFPQCFGDQGPDCSDSGKDFLFSCARGPPVVVEAGKESPS